MDPRGFNPIWSREVGRFDPLRFCYDEPGMTIESRSSLLMFMSFAVTASGALTQTQTGAVAFIARSGTLRRHEEPVSAASRFFLLSKSFEDITKKSRQPIQTRHECLHRQAGSSKELKAWMKKNQRGSTLRRGFHPQTETDDIMAFREFYDAYIKELWRSNREFPEAKIQAVGPRKRSRQV